MSLLAHNNTSVTLYSDDSDDPDYLEKHTVSDADAAVSESSSQLESISPIAKPKPRTDQQILRLPAIAPAVAIASQEPKMRGRPRKLAPSIQDRPSDGSESAGPGRLASRAMSDDSDADSAVLESPSRTVPVRPNIKLTTVRGRPRLQDITPVTSNTISAPRPRGRPWKSAPPVISALPSVQDPLSALNTPHRGPGACLPEPDRAFILDQSNPQADSPNISGVHKRARSSSGILSHSARPAALLQPYFRMVSTEGSAYFC